ncbi:MAG: hypothetical protein Q8M09_18140 [Pseudomonadota bacterium]|nr:hypothetical protein [Pseudomonadota bacterium]MDP1572900.1 hypothetical protein [Pseudomonadota bacterium]MDP1906136.1 hypothetical protein [Pseudomonadota bacterium]
MNTKTIVENVLTPARAKELWSANYFTALPFTPQHFEVGSLLPAMLYMARWGHRRGKGHFIETFGRQDAQGKAQPPRLVDVASGLLTRAGGEFDGFAGDHGPAMLADLLLTYCLENKEHALGHGEGVQRVFPTHYLASWLDLPKEVANLRGVPEMLTALLAWQDKGGTLAQRASKAFPVGGDFSESPLLALFGRHVEIDGPAANLASDRFMEQTADDLGVDELLAIRLAQVCGHAPGKVPGAGADIPNRWPIAKTAAKYLRGDLSTFIEAYGASLPRQAFLPMLEAGIGLGMANLLFSTMVCLSDWALTGAVPKDQQPMPLFVDCSHGLDAKLRNVSEAGMSEALARFERLPVLMMLARVLDDRVSHHPRLMNDLPPRQPDATAWLNLLGEVYRERHDRAESILERLEEDCGRLADELEKADEALEVVRALRNDQVNSALRLAEALAELIGYQQQGQNYLKALDSSLMPNRPNGLAFKRRVSRSEAGTKKSVDLRSIVLSHALLDFLVHRHLRKDGEGKAARPLTLLRFLDILRDHYGLYVDREPPGMSVPQDLLRANKAWLERRLRDLGLLVGVNDAESMKQLRARFVVPATEDGK